MSSAIFLRSALCGLTTALALGGVASAGEYNIFVDRVTIETGEFTRTGVGYNDDAWRGFGRAGVCKSKNDLTTHKYPLYGQIQRVGIVNDGPLPRALARMPTARTCLSSRPSASRRRSVRRRGKRSAN